MSGNAGNQILATRLLHRPAAVYPRRISTRQIEENIESQRFQYALAYRTHDFSCRRAEILDASLEDSIDNHHEASNFNIHHRRKVGELRMMRCPVSNFLVDILARRESSPGVHGVRYDDDSPEGRRNE